MVALQESEGGWWGSGRVQPVTLWGWFFLGPVTHLAPRGGCPLQLRVALLPHVAVSGRTKSPPTAVRAQAALRRGSAVAASSAHRRPCGRWGLCRATFVSGMEAGRAHIESARLWVPGVELEEKTAHGVVAPTAFSFQQSQPEESPSR